ncbi:MAG: type II secretion system protein [Gammaproteobacteria bacterium]|nr:type II secretion system protein [Gammaproteobacteria bacterium]
MYNNKKINAGFTLIEIAVVLVIIGVLIGSFIGTFTDRIDTTRRANTQQELEEIKRVLMAFAFSRPNPFLPCPDTDIPPDGDENRAGGVCTAAGAVGVLPWKTIGVGYDDAWGTRYSYWVNDNYANDPAGFLLTTGDNAGSARIDTRIGNATEEILDNAVAVIFSRGKNGLGGIGVDGVNRDVIPAVGNNHDDENENVDGDTLFYSRAETEEGAAVAGGIYDDILVWINSFELKAKMVEAGVLP